MSAKKNPPANATDVIETMAASGNDQRNIAKALGVSYPVWLRWKDEYPEIQEALDQGRAVEHDLLVGSLLESATKQKNVTAAIFLLKTRHGYRENENLAEGPKIQINFELPGAVDPKTYEAEILQKAVKDGKQAKKKRLTDD